MSEVEEKIISESIADDTQIDLQAEFKSSNIEEVLDKLDRELVGGSNIQPALHGEGRRSHP